MTRRRSMHRCVTAFVVMLSLLFSQMVLAAYVCPGMADSQGMAEAMAAGQPCERMDTEQPVLCHQRANGASLSFEQIKVATPSLPAIVQVLVVPLVLASQGHEVPPQSVPELHPPPDPVFLATRRLRV